MFKKTKKAQLQPIIDPINEFDALHIPNYWVIDYVEIKENKNYFSSKLYWASSVEEAISEFYSNNECRFIPQQVTPLTVYVQTPSRLERILKKAKEDANID